MSNGAVAVPDVGTKATTPCAISPNALWLPVDSQPTVDQAACALSPVLRFGRRTRLQATDGLIAKIKRDLADLESFTHGGAPDTTVMPLTNLRSVPISEPPPIHFIRRGCLDSRECLTLLAAPHSESCNRLHCLISPRPIRRQYATPAPIAAINKTLREISAQLPDRLRIIVSHQLSAEDAFQEAWASLADYYNAQRWANIQVRVSKDGAAFLINSRKRLLIFALFVKSSAIVQLVHAYHLVCSALAIIAVFMSHRHRHEPADGWLLSRTSVQSLAGCRSR